MLLRLLLAHEGKVEPQDNDVFLLEEGGLPPLAKCGELSPVVWRQGKELVSRRLRHLETFRVVDIVQLPLELLDLACHDLPLILIVAYLIM